MSNHSASRLQGTAGDQLVSDSGPLMWEKRLQDLTMEIVLYSPPTTKLLEMNYYS